MIRCDVTHCYGDLGAESCPFFGGLDVLGEKVVCHHPKRDRDFLPYVHGGFPAECPLRTCDVVIGMERKP